MAGPFRVGEAGPPWIGRHRRHCQLNRRHEGESETSRRSRVRIGRGRAVGVAGTVGR